jgi:anti-sigma B factor antagonist
MVGPVDGLAVVTPPAEIDLANAGQLREALELAGPEDTTIVVDMTANRFCDSSGISVLVRAHKRARAGGGEIRLVTGGATLHRVFKVTGLDRVFLIFDSLAEAITARHPRPGPVADRLTPLADPG